MAEPSRSLTLPIPPLSAAFGRLFVLVTRNRTTICSSVAVRLSCELEDEAEADVIVAVLRPVVVAVRDAAVLGVVVPAAAAVHAVIALMMIDLLCPKVRFFGMFWNRHAG